MQTYTNPKIYIKYNDTVIVKSLAMDEIRPEHNCISRVDFKHALIFS